MSLKKTEINASLFPGASGHAGPHTDGMMLGNERGDATTQQRNGESQTTTAVNTPMASTTLLKTEDVSGTEEKGDAHTQAQKHDKIILVQFASDDTDDPLNWTRAQKWKLTVLLCSMTMCIGLSTSAYSVGITRMSAELGFSTEVAQIGMFAFNFSCAVAPLFVAPLTELSGRRIVYLAAFAAFFAVTPMLAWGQNLATELIGRFLQGTFGACGTILAGGTLADIWSSDEISVPMSLFTFTAIFSTIAAPAYCGYIAEALGWRWIQYIHFILTGCVLLAEIFLLRESRSEAILLARAKKLRKQTGDDRFRAQIELEGDSIATLYKASSLRALKMLVQEPVVLLFGIWLALAWGTVFLFLSAIPLSFQTHRGWSEGNAGLPYLALVLGCFIGFAAGFYGDYMYKRAAQRNNGVPIPEARLYGAMAFSPCFPIGMFIFAFTQHVHWMGSMVGLVLIILGIYSTFQAVYAYTSDSFPTTASSAIAAQGLLRNGFGAVTPLFANYMLREQGLGIKWGGLLLALVASLCTLLPFVFFKKGEVIRSRSRYGNAKEGEEEGAHRAPKSSRDSDVEKAAIKAESENASTRTANVEA